MPARHPDQIEFLHQLQQALLEPADPPGPADRSVWRPTPFEVPSAYGILTQVVEDILPFVLEDAAIDEAPLVGSLPLARPEAELVPIPGSGRLLVVVERQLPVLAHLVAKALAAALPAQVEGDRLQLALDDESWQAALTADHPAVQRFVEAMVAAQSESPSAAPQYLGDPALEAVVSTLRQAIEWFELAQPYAHYAAGHHESAAREPWLEEIGPYERFAWTEAEEREAVVRALMAVLNRSQQAYGDVRMAAWALDAWLTTRMLIAGSPAVVEGLGQGVFDTLVARHAERRSLFRAMLEEDDALRPALGMVAVLEPVMEQFWEHTIQALLVLNAGSGEVM
jgi:hypothetical protein